MDNSPQKPSDKWIGRFAIGFGVGAIPAFIQLVFTDSSVETSLAGALVLGTLFGILASIGKRVLSFLIELMSRFS
jgi:hypothetical protein